MITDLSSKRYIGPSTHLESSLMKLSNLILPYSVFCVQKIYTINKMMDVSELYNT